MQLSELERRIREYTAVCGDSREVSPGSVFVTGPGLRTDGKQFAADAAARGARVIVHEGALDPLSGIERIEVPDHRVALAALASAFFGHPSREMLGIGVTGTCGKTTTTHLLESILQAAGRRVGLIGSVRYRWPGSDTPAKYTTPLATHLQKLLREMRDAGCGAFVMEVSSHALWQERARGIDFDLALFTNLSPEHLDLHGDMEEYFLAKQLLFTDYLERALEHGKWPSAAIHATGHGLRMAQAVRERHGARVPLLRFAMGGGDVELDGQRLQVEADGLRGRIDDVRIDSPLVGTFNAENVLAAVAGAKALGIDARAIEAGVHGLAAVPGRLERVPNGRGLRVYVDFAHKVDALERVLQALAELKGSGRLLVAFGCGGERDKSKRPKMGEVACRIADGVWITSDNPRREDPDRIIADILAGVPPGSVSVQPDRVKAIEQILSAARPGDTVLIAGRGGERTQIVRDPANPDALLEIPLDDCVVAADWLARAPAGAG